MRLERVIVALGLGMVSLLLVFGANGAHAGISAYAWPTSVAQGDSVNIYVSTDATSIDLTVYRRGKDLVQMASYPSLPGALHAIPGSVWSTGCGWPVTKRVPISPAWPSGVYYVLVTAIGIGSSYAIFTVREDDPGSTSSILFQNSITTWQAYNAWGGKSLYDYNSTDHTRSYVVSFQRPYDLYNGRGDFPRWEYRVIQFLEENGYPVEYCTDLDTHADPTLESHYDLVLSVGHDEYWSYQMRRTFEDRIAAGRNVAFLGGNTCWWQIRVTPDLRKIICYKNRSYDPLYGIADSLVTVNWFDNPVYRPENPLTGVSWRNGGYVDAEGWYPRSEGYGDYLVHRASDWVYEGTGLTEGSEFGWDDGIVGFETDGALYTTVLGQPVPTGADGTPLNFTIVATSIASQGRATMGYYTAPSGAMVFNVATTDWSDGLWGDDPHVEQITRNVLERLAPLASSVATTGPGVPGAPHASEGIVDVTPNPVWDRTHIRYSGSRDRVGWIGIYSAEGRLVQRLDVSGESGAGEVTWHGTDGEGTPVPAGIYFAVLQDGTAISTRKIIVLR